MNGRFDFNLSPEQEARAAGLHTQSIVFDLLSQHAGGQIFAHYPAALRREFEEKMSGAGNPFEAFAEAVYWPYEKSLLGESSLIQDWYQQSGLTCGMYGVDVHDGRDPAINGWESKVERYSHLPWVRYITTAEEVRRAKRDNVIAFYGNCQPSTPIPRDLKAIDRAYRKGLRSLMLTYNLMDNVGVGCTERVDAGLSMFGVDVVKHCNDIGIIVDVSHCGHLTTMDACRHSKYPVNANHTAAQGLFQHARGKSDDALRALADTGGVIGVVAVPAFLTSDRRPSIHHMLDHIDYIANLVGWEHVAIGTDWPLQAPDAILRDLLSPSNKELGFREQDNLDVTQRLVGFDDCRDLPNITRGLVARGYSDEKIIGILGENALRVLGAVCGK